LPDLLCGEAGQTLLQRPAGFQSSPGFAAPGLVFCAFHALPWYTNTTCEHPVSRTLFAGVAVVIAPGTQFGAYTIVAPLGAGGMGAVYRARDGRLDREVAVKFLHEELTHDPDRLARFEREARLLAAVNHPNIATIHSLEDHNGIRFLVMELVPGETLSEQIARGPLPLAAAVDAAKQVALALDAAHEQGIVHRDLKPANVKITPRGLVKVLDFGLAKNVLPAVSVVTLAPGGLRDEATPSGMILGTPAYMSPEQARGLAVDKRADIWAFGCLLYEALTGRRPFAGPTVSDVLAGILEREPDWDALPAHGPPRLRELLERCLRKDAGRRLRDIGDARIELEEAAYACDLSDGNTTTITVLPGTTIVPEDTGPTTAQPAAVATMSAIPSETSVVPLAPVQFALATPARRSRAPWVIAGASAGMVLLLLGGLLAWKLGLFSSKEDPTPNNVVFEFGPSGARIKGIPGGPDDRPINFEMKFPDFSGGFFDKPDERPVSGVAVLPYVPTSTFGDTELDKWADNLAFRITTALAGTSGLKVKAHAEAVRYKHLGDDPKMASRFLEVGAVLVIKVARERSGNVITADLVAADGTQLWVQQYAGGGRVEELAQTIAAKVREKTTRR
jgi:serine/threonine protein kinase/TolB-like protein